MEVNIKIYRSSKNCRKHGLHTYSLKIYGQINTFNQVSCQDFCFISLIFGDDINEDIFKGIQLVKKIQYELGLIQNPLFEIHAARKILYAIRRLSMVELEIIRKITEGTLVLSPMVVVRNIEKIRVCIDPTVVSKNAMHQHYPLTTCEEGNRGKMLTILDCRKGFWQKEVSIRNEKYLTFATQWASFCCRRLSFGLSSATGAFQEVKCTEFWLESITWNVRWSTFSFSILRILFTPSRLKRCGKLHRWRLKQCWPVQTLCCEGLLSCYVTSSPNDPRPKNMPRNSVLSSLSRNVYFRGQLGI